MTKVSVRVPDDLKAETDAFEINVSEVVRDALRAEVRRRRRERLAERNRELVDRVGVPEGDGSNVASVLRGERDRRTDRLTNVVEEHHEAVERDGEDADDP
ncbi:type II toxin-antitoxin system CcdA family antitoxin [Halobium palmae]|uniref:Type II toxin-antitoxin system CcdA family antitoxin n=1 Tax=Halobium palmae TaxID=1776492 RepID=A0ABD5RZ47_9EURY